MGLSDNAKIGILLISLGFLFLSLGVMLFFDAGLMAIGECGPARKLAALDSCLAGLFDETHSQLSGFHEQEPPVCRPRLALSHVCYA